MVRQFLFNLSGLAQAGASCGNDCNCASCGDCPRFGCRYNDGGYRNTGGVRTQWESQISTTNDDLGLTLLEPCDDILGWDPADCEGTCPDIAWGPTDDGG